MCNQNISLLHQPPQLQSNMQQQQQQQRGRKRTRSAAAARTAKLSLAHKANLVTLCLWLIAFITTHPSASSVKAFVLASDRPHLNPSTFTTTTSSSSKHKSLTTTLPHTHDQHDATTSLFSTLAPAIRAEDLLSIGQQYQDEAAEALDFGSATSPISMLPDIPSSRFGTIHAAAAATDVPAVKKSMRYPTVSPVAIVIAADPSEVKIPDEEEVLEWAHRYTSVEALREHFGTNQNKLWGDLQASTARRLYKTLLPRALLELSKLGQLQPQDLAPLAYQARVAAKLYARERCTVPARIAATLFDGFRQWIKYGKFQAHGMTYDQLWEKYAEKVLQETESRHALAKPPALHHLGDSDSESEYDHNSDDEEECEPFHSSDDCEDHYQEISEQVCRKILERACVSNEGVDSLALRGQDLADETHLQPDQRRLLERIRAQLEDDMYQLLIPNGEHHHHHHHHHDYDYEQDKKEKHRYALLPTLAMTKNPLKQGRYRLVRGLAKQRRFWNLSGPKKNTARDRHSSDRHDQTERDDSDSDASDNELRP